MEKPTIPTTDNTLEKKDGLERLGNILKEKIESSQLPEGWRAGEISPISCGDKELDHLEISFWKKKEEENDYYLKVELNPNGLFKFSSHPHSIETPVTEELLSSFATVEAIENFNHTGFLRFEQDKKT